MPNVLLPIAHRRGLLPTLLGDNEVPLRRPLDGLLLPLSVPIRDFLASVVMGPRGQFALATRMNVLTGKTKRNVTI